LNRAVRRLARGGLNSQTLGFPALADLSIRQIEGEAVIIRKDLNKEENQATLGLKFTPCSLHL
jgi:hypothetical protein